MTDFSDCIDYIDRIKVEFHERFTYLLEVNAQLEERLAKLEPDTRFVNKYYKDLGRGGDR